jgi:DNA polymerase III epsilon subunit-like protein
LFIFLDTETTCAGQDDRGYANWLSKQCRAGQGRSGLFDPAKSIAIEAMAVHHITNEMVKDRPAFKQSDLWYKLRALFDK